MTTHTIKEGFIYQGQAYNILITLPEASEGGFKRNETEITEIITKALESLAAKSAHGKDFKPLSARFIIPLKDTEAPKVSYKKSEDGEEEEDLSDVDLIDHSRLKTIADLLKTISEFLKIEQLVVHSVAK